VVSKIGAEAVTPISRRTCELAPDARRACEKAART